MKRAALIITDADHVEYSTYNLEEYGYRQQGQLVDPSEQLLADLRTVVAPWDASVDVLVAARANIRKLLPDKDSL